MAKAKRVPCRERMQSSSAIGITFLTVCIHVASIEISCNSLPDRPGEGYMGPLTCDPLYIWIVIIKACCPFHRDLQSLWRRYPDIVTCVWKDTSSQGTFSQIEIILKNMYISFFGQCILFLLSMHARTYEETNLMYSIVCDEFQCLQGQSLNCYRVLAMVTTRYWLNSSVDNIVALWFVFHITTDALNVRTRVSL